MRTDKDTREKLEEDARAVIVGGYVSVDDMRRWLDRQAAITRAELQGCPGYDAERHYCKYHANDFELTREQVCDLKREVSRLECERDELQTKLDAYGETHMELPLDADGVPIRAGDLVEVVGMEDGKAVTIACDERGRWSVAVKPHHWDTPTVYSADELRHVNPRTVEDVLRELIADTRKERIVGSKVSDEQIAKYADELRELMEVER